MKFRVICPYCDHTVTAKAKGAAKLVKHLQDEHPGRAQEEVLFSSEGVGRRPATDDMVYQPRFAVNDPDFIGDDFNITEGETP